jgi:hypothetical protein
MSVPCCSLTASSEWAVRPFCFPIEKKQKSLQIINCFEHFRTQRACDGKAYLSAFREEDSKGNLGVTLKRDLLQVVGETLKSNITILGSSFFPFLQENLPYCFKDKRAYWAWRVWSNLQRTLSNSKMRLRESRMIPNRVSLSS